MTDKYAEDSAEYVVQQFITRLYSGQMEELKALISQDAKDELAQLRGNRLEAARLEAIKVDLAGVKLARSAAAQGKKIIALDNKDNERIQFQVARQGDKRVIVAWRMPPPDAGGAGPAAPAAGGGAAGGAGGQGQAGAAGGGQAGAAGAAGGGQPGAAGGGQAGAGGQPQAAAKTESPTGPFMTDKYAEDSAEYVVQQFITRLYAGQMEELKALISQDAKDELAQLRGNRLEAARLDAIKAALAGVKLARSAAAQGKKIIALDNKDSKRIQFQVAKQGDKRVIVGLNIPE